MNTARSNFARLWRIGAATATVVVLTGCGGEDIAERFVENRIEAESGDNVDIDLSGGNIRIQTDEGVVEMNADGEGNISIRGDGLDGDFSIGAEDGMTVFEGEDGMATFSQSADIPDSFPGSVPLPNGLVPEFTQTMTVDEGDVWTIGGSIAATPGDVGPVYLDALAAAGFERLSLTETPDGYLFTFDDTEYTVTGMVGDGGDGSSYVNLTVSTSQD